MDAPNRPPLQPTLVYYTVPVLVLPAPVSAVRFAAHHGTTPRHHPYVRPTFTARLNHIANPPAPISPSHGFIAHPQALPSVHRRPLFYTPPHPLDPRVAIHPPLSPREIHRRQQERQGRRLVALFSIPEFRQVVRDGFDVAMLEKKRQEASTSTSVVAWETKANATDLGEGSSQSANAGN